METSMPRRAEDEPPSRRKEENLERRLFLLVGIVVAAAVLVVISPMQRQEMQTRWNQDYHFGDVSSAVGDQVTSGECSCFNSEANGTCCRRVVLRAHKFGHVLTNVLFKPFPSIERMNFLPKATLITIESDYRHVAMVRNIYGAIVSGYLYHKSGRECWLTISGTRRPKSWREGLTDWYQYVQSSEFDIGRIPKPTERSICKLLADETEEIGMKVYIAMALPRFYHGVVSYVALVKEKERQGNGIRTKFVCFEDAVDPQQEKAVFYEMMDWLYPGGHKFKYPIKDMDNKTYSGSHATDHDPNLRQRLRELAMQLDRTVFNGTLSLIESHFKCKAPSDR